MRFIVLEISLVPIPVRVAFHAFAVASILVPVSLVDARLAVNHNAHALPAVVGQLPSIDGVVVPLDAEGRQLCDCNIVKDVTLHKIVIIDTHRLPLFFINKHQVPLNLLDSLLLGEKNLHGLFVKVCGVAETSRDLLHLADSVVFLDNVWSMLKQHGPPVLFLMQGGFQLHRTI